MNNKIIVQGNYILLPFKSAFSVFFYTLIVLYIYSIPTSMEIGSITDVGAVVFALVLILIPEYLYRRFFFLKKPDRISISKTEVKVFYLLGLYRQVYDRKECKVSLGKSFLNERMIVVKTKKRTYNLSTLWYDVPKEL